jgi:CAAX prenyl protease-like protein
VTASQRATVAYAAPFALYVAMMAAERTLGLPVQFTYPLRVAVVAAIIWVFSRRVIGPRPTAPLASVGIGIAVFLIWIGPDVIFGPAWRHFWLFENAITGTATTSIPHAAQRTPVFLVIRVLGSALLVPILEELFWRGWLMRWLIRTDFQKVQIGAYAPVAFWITAALFAAEHGSFWEVGLLAGVVYNWWVVRTRNLADAMLAHGVTNGLLAAYVLLYGQWQYWL